MKYIVYMYVHTCHNKKSLNLISPDVLISRSGLDEFPVYKLFSNKSSETSL